MSEKKYYALYKRLAEGIIQQEYKTGEKLPSKRTMADLSGCSVITVAAAYELLEQEGYIISRQRSGYYVCRIDTVRQNKKVQKTKIDFLPTESKAAEKDLEYSLWFKTVRKVMAERGQELFIKSPREGCAILRNAIAEYLLRYRGMIAQPAQIIIGSGAEQLYESVIKMLGRDKIYGIEDPCYEQIPAVYRGEGATVCPLQMGKDGIRTKELQEKHFDVLHVTPVNSFPSGITATISKRWQYLAWAEKNNSYVIEDDFAGEFFLPGRPIESLYALDNRDCVIYMNTFSKSLSPSMRMGYMIIPAALMGAYEENMGCYSCSVPVFDQYVLAEFISSGCFERHLNRVRRKQATKLMRDIKAD